MVLLSDCMDKNRECDCCNSPTLSDYDYAEVWFVDEELEEMMADEDRNYVQLELLKEY